MDTSLEGGTRLCVEPQDGLREKIIHAATGFFGRNHHNNLPGESDQLKLVNPTLLEPIIY
jgi:hypothetical protein